MRREIEVLKQLVEEQRLVNKLQGEKLQNLVDKTVSVTHPISSHSPPVLSYAEAIKSSKPKPCLFIKSGDNVDSKKLTEEIKSCINPVELNVNINNARVTRKGLLVNCEDANSLETLKNSLSQKMGTKIVVEESTSFKPRLKIQGVERSRVESGHFISDLIGQNSFACEADDIRVITRLGEKYLCDVVVEVNHSLRKIIMDKSGVYVGWRRCRVVDHLRITRCFKCSHYGHFQRECRSGITCPVCAESHEQKDCTSSVKKCVNCVAHNVRFKTNFPEDHSVRDSCCSVYKQKLHVLISKINYNGL